MELKFAFCLGSSKLELCADATCLVTLQLQSSEFNLICVILWRSDNTESLDESLNENYEHLSHETGLYNKLTFLLRFVTIVKVSRAIVILALMGKEIGVNLCGFRYKAGLSIQWWALKITCTCFEHESQPGEHRPCGSISCHCMNSFPGRLRHPRTVSFQFSSLLLASLLIVNTVLALRVCSFIISFSILQEVVSLLDMVDKKLSMLCGD